MNQAYAFPRTGLEAFKAPSISGESGNVILVLTIGFASAPPILLPFGREALIEILFMGQIGSGLFARLSHCVCSLPALPSRSEIEADTRFDAPDAN